MKKQRTLWTVMTFAFTGTMAFLLRFTIVEEDGVFSSSLCFRLLILIFTILKTNEKAFSNFPEEIVIRITHPCTKSKTHFQAQLSRHFENVDALVLVFYPPYWSSVLW